MQHVFPSREVIRRQLHNERSGITRKQTGLFEDDAADDNGRNADEIGAGRDPAGVMEQCTRNQGDDGHLCAAGNEGRRHDGHFTVTVILNGTAGHDTGHTAAGRDQHGDKALARQAELSENTVHNEGDTRHVADVFQNGQEEEQHQHLRYKTQHRADAADDTVSDQAYQPIGRTDLGQPLNNGRLHPLRHKNIIGKIRYQGADAGHRHIVDAEHDHGENRQRSDTVRDHAVDTVRYAQLSFFAAFFNASRDQTVDIRIALVGDDGFRIVVQFFFAFLNVFFDGCLDAGRQVQLVLDLFIALKELDGIPARQVGGYNAAFVDTAVRMMMMNRFFAILMGDQVFDMRQRMFYAAFKNVHIVGARALLGDLFSRFRCLDGPFTLQRRGFHHAAAQGFAQFCKIDLVAVFARHVDHVERNHHGDAQFCQLCGQIQVALDVGRVHDVQDRVGPFLHQIVSCHHFFQSIGRKAVNAGQVLNDDMFFTLEFALFLFHRNARPVTNILVRTRQVIEHRRLAAVRVTC